MDTNKREELQRDARKANKIDLERAEMFEKLVASPAWRMFEDLLNHHISIRQQQLLEPVTDGNIYASEHNKGALYGMIYARDLPRVTVVMMQELKRTSSSDPAGDDNA